MGDFNDDPTSPSVVNGLRSKTSAEGLAPTDLFNPMAALYSSGRGTLAYRDVWNLFDNLVVTPNLIGGPADRLHLQQDKATGELRLYLQCRLPHAEDGALQGLSLPHLLLGSLQGAIVTTIPSTSI